MPDRLRRPDGRTLSLAGLVLAGVAFLSVNLFAGLQFGGFRADLTRDRLYSVSDGTRQILRTLEEPVHLRLYASSRLLRTNPTLSAYADRVRSLLASYQELAGGRLRLDVIDPDPFSPDEDRAIAFGLRGTPLPGTAERGFFGLAATNTTDDIEVIPQLSPDREPFLEYDLTRMVYGLANPTRPVVAVLDGLGLAGNPQRDLPTQQVLEPLRQFFQLRLLPADAPYVPAEVQVLMVVHPQALAPRTLYAIDQFVLRGGRIIAFVDPSAEGTPENAQAGPGTPPSASDLDRLLTAWGVEMLRGEVVLDRRQAQRVQASRAGRALTTEYLPWLAVRRDGLAADDHATGQLSVLSFASAGALRQRPDATTRFAWLARTTPDSMRVPARQVFPSPDPFQLLRDFQASGERQVLAARITGPVSTAFPDGPPPGATPQGEHRRTAAQPLNAVVVADADLLVDGSWLEAGRGGDGAPVPIANNADFVLRAVEHLAGTPALLDLPVRQTSTRPFAVLEELRNAAEQRFRETERQLLDRLREAEERINRIAADNRTAGIDVILTPDQQQAIERFRAEAVGIRTQLRDVQRALRADIDRLDGMIKALNVAVAPMLAGAGLFAFNRWRRRGGGLPPRITRCVHTGMAAAWARTGRPIVDALRRAMAPLAAKLPGIPKSPRRT
ncbi:MAG TPA: Gldg family protein [Azospirillaceae bacterium]|nr:Gldg family protein [Azospirillaceae bacterium]